MLQDFNDSLLVDYNENRVKFTLSYGYLDKVYEAFNHKTNQNEKKQKKNIITINSLKTKEIYDINWIINKNLLYKVGLNYDDNIFYSNNFPLMEDTSENLLKKVILRDKNSNILISNTIASCPCLKLANVDFINTSTY